MSIAGDLVIDPEWQPLDEAEVFEVTNELRDLAQAQEDIDRYLDGGSGTVAVDIETPEPVYGTQTPVETVAPPTAPADLQALTDTYRLNVAAMAQLQWMNQENIRLAPPPRYIVMHDTGDGDIHPTYRAIPETFTTTGPRIEPNVTYERRPRPVAAPTSDPAPDDFLGWMEKDLIVTNAQAFRGLTREQALNHLRATLTSSQYAVVRSVFLWWASRTQAERLADLASWGFTENDFVMVLSILIGERRATGARRTEVRPVQILPLPMATALHVPKRRTW